MLLSISIPNPMSSRDCNRVISGIARTHCHESNGVPDALICLMVSFLNLWDRFSLTVEEMRKLYYRCFYGRGTSFNITPITFGKLLIRCRLNAVRTGNLVQLRFSVDLPSKARHIGGFFKINHYPLEEMRLNEASFKRIEGRDRMVDEIQCSLVDLDSLLESKDLSFSRYVDIRQVQYAESGPIKDFDGMPPLNKYWKYQWSIQEEELNQLYESKRLLTLGTTKSIGWGLRCVFREASDPLVIRIRRPYLPVQIRCTGLKVNLRSTIKMKDGNTVEFEMETDPFTHCKNVGVYRTVSTGVSRDNILNATSIILDIEWELINPRDYRMQIYTSDWARLGINDNKQTLSD